MYAYIKWIYFLAKVLLKLWSGLLLLLHFLLFVQMGSEFIMSEVPTFNLQSSAEQSKSRV